MNVGKGKPHKTGPEIAKRERLPTLDSFKCVFSILQAEWRCEKYVTNNDYTLIEYVSSGAICQVSVATNIHKVLQKQHIERQLDIHSRNVGNVWTRPIELNINEEAEMDKGK